MKRLLFGAGLLAILAAGAPAGAIPVYVGDTSAPWFRNPARPAASGYYLWSRDEARTEWSIRWTGNNDGGPADSSRWYGQIRLPDGVGIATASAVAFEGRDCYDLVAGTAGSQLSWLAWAGPAWDGIDFTLTDALDPRGMDLWLGSTLFTASLTPGGRDLAGMGIFIGEEFATPDVDVRWLRPYSWVDATGVTRTSRGRSQVFNGPPAPVPEPASLLLLGTGLLGAGAVLRRRRAG